MIRVYRVVDSFFRVRSWISPSMMTKEVCFAAPLSWRGSDGWNRSCAHLTLFLYEGEQPIGIELVNMPLAVHMCMSQLLIARSRHPKACV